MAKNSADLHLPFQRNFSAFTQEDNLQYNFHLLPELIFEAQPKDALHFPELANKPHLTFLFIHLTKARI
ncbi:TPA: hypothetical protein DEG21_05530 [Patescibacteria group bacterium]|nr:hypothetical protein [Candidatus Gracilibacteria bacterium]HBY75283.1 hypothetical protein [Candidatus Gracilibacteria bacterium]